MPGFTVVESWNLLPPFGLCPLLVTLSRVTRLISTVWTLPFPFSKSSNDVPSARWTVPVWAPELPSCHLILALASSPSSLSTLIVYCKPLLVLLALPGMPFLIPLCLFLFFQVFKWLQFSLFFL